MRTVEPGTARRLWKALDAYHAVVYFDPEPREEYAALGLKGGWMGYFASRSAAMGAVAAEPVVAAFYGFHPRLVQRALPDAWAIAPPSAVLDARLRGADRALRRRLGDLVESPEVKQAAVYAREAVEACDPAGRVLFAAHTSLPWPDAPHLVLWHAATLYREYRGDGHVACLVMGGFSPRASLIMHAADDGPDADTLRAMRGWSEEEWADTVVELHERGWTDGRGNATASGLQARARVEERTDALSLPPWEALGPHHADRLLELVRTITAAF